MTKNNNFHNPRNPENRDQRDNRDRDNRGNDRRNFDRRDHNKFRHNQKPKKSLILLKSTVFGLFIVLITLLVAFVLVKNKKIDISAAQPKCASNEIVLDNQIEKVDFIDNEIVIVTQNGKSKEIIRFDAKCGKETNRIKISTK